MNQKLKKSGKINLLKLILAGNSIDFPRTENRIG